MNEGNTQFTKFSSQHEQIMAAYAQEHLRGTIEFARDSLKCLTLLNGGAAIALLAFTGNIWSNEISIEIIKINLLIYAIIAFTVGVVFSAFGSALGYFVLKNHYDEGAYNLKRQMLLTFQFSGEMGDGGLKHVESQIQIFDKLAIRAGRRANFFSARAGNSALISLVLLVFGVFFSCRAFF